MTTPRSPRRLSDAEFEAVATRAAQITEEKIYENLYLQVGKAVVRKGLYLVGTVFSAYIVIKWNHIKDWLNLL